MDDSNSNASRDNLDAAASIPDAGYTYLTTDELAVRIRYDARTIRDRLNIDVLREGVHYIRPFGGRKILYIWENIARDMHAFSKAVDERDQLLGSRQRQRAKKDRPWSPIEDKYLRDTWGKASVKELSAALGRSQTSIHKRAPVLGLTRPDEWNEAELALMREHFEAEGPVGLSMRLGRTPNAVKLQAGRMGLRQRPVFEPWSPKENDLLRQIAGTMPLRQIHNTYFQAVGKALGQEFCRSFAAVAEQCGALGISLSRRDAARAGRSTDTNDSASNRPGPPTSATTSAPPTEVAGDTGGTSEASIITNITQFRAAVRLSPDLSVDTQATVREQYDPNDFEGRVPAGLIYPADLVIEDWEHAPLAGDDGIRYRYYLVIDGREYLGNELRPLEDSLFDFFLSECCN